MAEEQENFSIFGGVKDAINKNKKRTPITTDPGVVQHRGGGDNLIRPGSNIENVQQQFLDWQVNKIAHDLYTRTIYYDTDRINAYQDFRAMDMSPEIAAALNIMRDECITRGDKGKILDIFSENSRVKDLLEDLFYNRLDIDFALKLWIRDLLKYGDFFLQLHIDKDEGIYDVMALPSEEIHREEGYEGRTDDVRFRWETTGDYFEDWQVAHFRLLEDTRKLPYGRSILDPARKLWKQLQLAEDSMLVYRITRAPERRVFYIDVGNLEHADVGQFIQQFQMQLKKQPIVDQKTGNINMKYNPMNVTEDYFIPMRADRSSRIETLPGACLALDTKIDLLDGRSLELNDIIKEHEEGKELWSYSINPDTGKVVPGKITWAGVTRKDAKVVKITLDNGETITTTPDHKFPTRFNGIKEAKDLVEGESMWAFNKKFEKIKGAGKKRKRNTYEMIYDHSENKWLYTHRIIANYFRDLNLHEEFVHLKEAREELKNTIHHKNFNRYDNSPDNLCFMNSRDHFYYHQDNMKRLEEFFGVEKVEEWKALRREGIKEYWNNISEEELNNKIEIAKINFKKGSDKLQELLLDPEYKKEFYKKTSKTLKIVRGTDKARNKQSEITKEQWKGEGLRNAIIEKQTIKYSDKMLQFVSNRFKDGMSAGEILIDINSENSLFMSEFDSLNKGNAQLKKMKNGFTHNNLVKMMKSFGYSNWSDFKNKAEYFNHKIVSVEFLSDTQDTGTITIDGNEMYHDYHNFALSVGVFTNNSNLGDIQDIEYFQNKLFASLQVPKNYLNYGESLPGGSTLSQQDLRFSRTINTIQQAVLAELKRIANIHLYFNGFKDEIDNFTLTLANPSTQQELLKLETMKARIEVFKEMFSAEATSPVSYVWAMENILGFSKNEIKLILKQKKVEKKIFAEIDSSIEMYKKIGLFKELDEKFEIEGAEEMMAAEQGGEEGGDEGGDMGGGGGGFGGGMDMGGDLDMGGEDFGEEGGEEAPAEEAPLAENKFNKAMNISDRYTSGLINELLGADESPKKNNIEDNALIKRGSQMRLESEKLMKRMNNSDIINRGVGKSVIQEEVKKTSSLIQGSEKLGKDSDSLMSEVEKYLRTRKKGDV